MVYGTNHTTKHKENGNPVQVDTGDLKAGDEKHQKELRAKTAHIGQEGKVPEYTGGNNDDHKNESKEEK